MHAPFEQATAGDLASARRSYMKNFPLTLVRGLPGHTYEVLPFPVNLSRRDVTDSVTDFGRHEQRQTCRCGTDPRGHDVEKLARCAAWSPADGRFYGGSGLFRHFVSLNSAHDRAARASTNGLG
jgi:hypothetical protein